MNKIDFPEKRETITRMVRENPNMPSNQMARILYKKYPEWFSSKESARDLVRLRRGAHGDNSRKDLKNHKDYFQNRTGFNWALPKAINESWEPFILPTGLTLVLSDIHPPFHDETALNAALDYGATLNNGKGPDTVLLNGDIVDFYGLSRFEKDPRKCNLAQEVMAVRSILGYLRQLWPKSKIIYKFGNHDERWEKRLWEKGAEYLDLPQMQLEEILTGTTPETEKFKAQPEIERIEFVKNQRPIMAGKLAILHGHEFPKGMTASVNPARGNFMRGLECSLAGHNHRTSEHVEPSMLGKVISCWSTGCLCQLHPEYARINKWNHGFATVDFKNGQFEVNNLRVIKGKVYG